MEHNGRNQQERGQRVIRASVEQRDAPEHGNAYLYENDPPTHKTNTLAF